MSDESSGITSPAAKFIYKTMVEAFKQGKEVLPLAIAKENDLWLVDEWTHVGYCVLTCLDNMKLVETYCKGNPKVMDALIGKAIKFANMTVEPELIKDLMPLVIERHFKKA